MKTDKNDRNRVGILNFISFKKLPEFENLKFIWPENSNYKNTCGG